ncbi:MAG: hypothetical protein R6V03_10310 [Kiritimatiellia bacterium]
MKDTVKKRGVVAVRWCFIAATALLMAAGIAAHARVFMRWGAAEESRRAMESAGGRHAYSADITLNGTSAELAVFHFADSLPAVAGQLNSIFGSGTMPSRAQSMAAGAARDSNRYLRFLALETRPGAGTLVFRIDQSRSEAERSLKPPRPSAQALPPYPGCSPVFSAANGDTGTRMAVSETTASSGDIRSFYRSRLEEAGWVEVLHSPYGSGSSAEMAVFLRENEIACVHVMPAERTGQNRITLVRKRHRE